MIDLTSYGSVQSNLFVRIEVSYYKATAASTPTSTVLRFSDLRENFQINGENYIGIGNLMGVSSSSSELRTSSGELTITIAGIPNTSIYEIVNSRIKGCPVRIYKCFFDADTGAKLDIADNPTFRYRGFVNNYSLQEEWDSETRTSSNSIVLICNSSIDVLQNKVTGRQTNPQSQQKFFPTDLSMNRVPTLENATFDFGAPK
jgi:hypothetical protein